MVQAGDSFENPLSGQRLIFRKTARETGGELVEVESLYTKPSPLRPPPHYHPSQEERFEILSGEVHAQIGGEQRTFGEGDVFMIAPRTPHTMWAEEAGARLNWQTRPALKTEAFFETLWGLAQDGKVNDSGVPNLLRVALIAREYREEYRLVSPPQAIQRMLFGSLAVVGKPLGYEGQYPYPQGGADEDLGAEGARPPVGQGARMSRLLVSAVFGGLLVLFLLRWLRRQSKR